MVPHCLLWCLWRERNSQCFEDKKRSISDLKLFFFRTLMDWLAALWNQSFLSFLDFLDACNFCSWLFDLLYTPCVLGCSPFLISINILLIKKKKKIIQMIVWSCGLTIQFHQKTPNYPQDAKRNHIPSFIISFTLKISLQQLSICTSLWHNPCHSK